MFSQTAAKFSRPHSPVSQVEGREHHRGETKTKGDIVTEDAARQSPLVSTVDPATPPSTQSSLPAPEDHSFQPPSRSPISSGKYFRRRRQSIRQLQAVVKAQAALIGQLRKALKQTLPFPPGPYGSVPLSAA